MICPFEPWKPSSAMYLHSRIEEKATEWLSSEESAGLIARVENDKDALVAAHEFYGDWFPEKPTWREISAHFVRDYTNAGVASGFTLRVDPRSQILISDMAAREDYLEYYLRSAVKKLRNNSPLVYNFMLDLLCVHMALCHEVIRKTFCSDFLILRRGVDNLELSHPIESWAYGGDSDEYGTYSLWARIPVSSIISVRRQEYELVVARNASRVGKFRKIKASPRGRLGKALLKLGCPGTWAPSDLYTRP